MIDTQGHITDPQPVSVFVSVHPEQNYLSLYLYSDRRPEVAIVYTGRHVSQLFIHWQCNCCALQQLIQIDLMLAYNSF